MAYNQTQLDAYRLLISRGEPFKSAKCPYCNGQRDATVKHIHPSTKPANAWSFWQDILIKKYAPLQSAAARKNLESTAHFENNGTLHSETVKEDHCSDISSARMFVVGPMVDQSELPFRMLCRAYGATLAYTPMLHAKSFAEGATYRRHFFTTTPLEEVKAALENVAAAPSSMGVAVDSAPETLHDIAASSSFSLTKVVTQLVDRPCIVQFCGHDADTVLAAARYAVLGEGAGTIEHSSSNNSHGCGSQGAHCAYPIHVYIKKTVDTAGKNAEDAVAEEDGHHLLYGCDAVDLNLGCPQGIARRGHYGSFLMEDWDLIHTIIHTLHVELEVPVTVKIRVFDHPGQIDNDSADTPLKKDFDEALTILYARMIRDAGAQLLCVHGRTRDMKGQQTSVANMELIRRVRRALEGTIPVISNGNVYTYDDVMKHLRETECEGHMCAEPLLWDPTLFSTPPHPVMPGRTHGADKATRLSALHTALAYMAWVRRYPVDIGFVKAHLFKMCFHSYELHTDFREALGQLKTNAANTKDGEEDGEEKSLKTFTTTECNTAPINNSNGKFDSIEINGGARTETETEDAVSVHSVSTAGTVFGQYVDAIESHLRQLIEAERKSSVEGEQPKTAQAEKVRLKQETVDVLEEEGGLGIDF